MVVDMNFVIQAWKQKSVVFFNIDITYITLFHPKFLCACSP